MPKARAGDEPQELLARVIAASGLSARRYATEVLKHNERTIRRWLAGDTPISPFVLEFLSRQPRSK